MERYKVSYVRGGFYYKVYTKLEDAVKAFDKIPSDYSPIMKKTDE